MATWPALVIVFGLFLATMPLSVAYFSRYRMPPPPLGVMNGSDVALALVCIVLVPYLHMALPPWASTLFLALVMGSLFHLLLEPIVARRSLRWLLVVAGVGLGVAAPRIQPGNPHVYTAINNALIVLAIVAISNVWVQSGLSTRNLVVLVLAITVYDIIFTGRLPLTADVFGRLDHRPFEPLIAWRDGPVWPAMGLGDTLLSATFAVGLAKAWGRGAATTGILAMALAAVLAFTRPFFGVLFVTSAYPAMVVFGPVQLAVYWLCRRRYGAERTLAEYRRDGAARATAPEGPAPVGESLAAPSR